MSDFEQIAAKDVVSWRKRHAQDQGDSNNGITKRTRGLQTPNQTTLASPSGLANSSATSVPSYWYPVNPDHPSGTPIPTSLSTPSYAQLASKALENYPEGLSSQNIFELVRNEVPERPGSDKTIRGGISAALSAGSRGSTAKFQKLPANDTSRPQKFIWKLNKQGDDSFISRVADDSPETLAIAQDAADSSTPIPESHRVDETSNEGDGHADEVAHMGHKALHSTIAAEEIGGAGTHLDRASSMAVEVINSALRSPSLDDAMQRSPSEATATKSACDLTSQPGPGSPASPIHLLRALSTPARRNGSEDQENTAMAQVPAVPAENYEESTPVSGIQDISASKASMQVVAEVIKKNPALQQPVHGEFLHPSLAVTLSLYNQLWRGYLQPGAEGAEVVRDGSLHNGDAITSVGNAPAISKALFQAFKADKGLDNLCAPCPVTSEDAHGVLDSIDRTKAIDTQVDLVTLPLAAITSQVEAKIELLQVLLQSLAKTTETYEGYKTEIGGIRSRLRQRLAAYIEK